MAYIYHNPHRQALIAVEQELIQRRQELQFAQQRIVELEKARKALGPLVQADYEGELNESLPMLCLRVLLSTANNGVSVPQIREQLRLMGVQLLGKNPLGMLHTALGRLAKSGLVTPIPTGPSLVNHFQITMEGMIALQQSQDGTGPAPGGF